MAVENSLSLAFGLRRANLIRLHFSVMEFKRLGSRGSSEPSMLSSMPRFFRGCAVAAAVVRTTV